MTILTNREPAHTGPINTIDGLEHLAGAASRSTAAVAATAPRARAVVYLRVSTPRQMQTAADLDEDGNSIATQREWTRDKAMAMGARIVAEFVEPGQSAQTIAKRPEFQKLLAYVDDHPERARYPTSHAPLIHDPSKNLIGTHRNRQRRCRRARIFPPARTP